MRETLPSRTWLQLFRVTSLLVPAAIGWHVVAAAREPGAFDRAATFVLGPLWCVLLLSFAKRVVDAAVRRWREGASEVTVLDRIEVLTASGSALAWLGAGAIALSVANGWASMSLVGVLGLALLQLVAIGALWATGGDDPWRQGSLTRRFVTERAVEGGPVLEELLLAGPRIPLGFRLFVRGRVGPRWVTSRYVVEGGDDGSEIRLQSDVGPAIRGEHHAEPLEVWLQDVLGLCRSMRYRVGRASLVVLPRARALRGAEAIVRAPSDAAEPRATPHTPTEGSLHLRDYQPGDDARRIHWARSLSTGQLVVRTPDEAPSEPDAIRLVLDTYLPGADGLTCPAPAELLDTLVAVWVGLARSFGSAGRRVELVVAGPDRVHVVAARRAARIAIQAEALGSRATWQDAIPLERVLTRGHAVVVSYRHQPVPQGAAAPLWVLAREWAWITFDREHPSASLVVLPHPMGSPENGAGRRRRDLLSYWRARHDHARFTRLCGDAPGSVVTAAAEGPRAAAGTFLATPSAGGAIHLERLS